MQEIDYGTKHLLITCFSNNDKQFGNIYKICKLVSKKDIKQYQWKNKKINLKRRRVLKTISIFGHGAKNAAEITDNQKYIIKPGDISVNDQMKIFFFTCHQGKSEIKTIWSEEMGIPIKNIYGSENTTETSLTVLLLIHLLESGIDNIKFLFDTWYKANDYFRKHFELIISTYREQNFNFDAAFKKLEKIIDFSPFINFLLIARKYPEYLNNIIQ